MARGLGAGVSWARSCAAKKVCLSGSAVSQLRREARLRREYLYRKACEEARRTAQERKDKVRRALEGTSVPAPQSR